ncbi:hypothetical protein HPB52_012732 [Rhipicephalus sanguineus]|uniref:Uncharacterized protein n=1 Tax=Rhipicephalus sanguineus TaxID=34632 RepID=A0A9D4QAM2_RHISA|nr:hypothetical protein HPB52_012732 [Rhipicephalus sanguineus]
MQLSIENSKLLFGHENDLLQASWMMWRSNREKDHARTPDHRRIEDDHASYMLRERLLVVHNPETARAEPTGLSEDYTPPEDYRMNPQKLFYIHSFRLLTIALVGSELLEKANRELPLAIS